MAINESMTIFTVNKSNYKKKKKLQAIMNF